MSQKRDWLKKIRIERGYTGPEIADKLGCKHSTWYGYEAGYRTPRGKDAIRIANLLKFPVELFFCNDVRETRHRKEVI